MGVGLMQGFVQRILFTVVFIFALAFSFLFYPYVAPLVRPLSPEGWEKALAFLLLFILVDTLGGLASQQVVRRVPPDFLESPVNKVAGIIPSLLNGVILLSFLMVSTIRYRTFKDLHLSTRSFAAFAFLSLVGVTVGIATRPSFVLVVYMAAYIAMGIAESLIARARAPDRARLPPSVRAELAEDEALEPDPEDVEGEKQEQDEYI